VRLSLPRAPCSVMIDTYLHGQTFRCAAVNSLIIDPCLIRKMYQSYFILSQIYFIANAPSAM
jgi:hypothetical protein